MKNPLQLNAVINTTSEILSQLLLVKQEEITPDSRVIDDLSADSLDVVDLSFQLGKRYGCTLPKINVLDHALEVCKSTQDFVQQGGITELGKSLLEGSLSDYSPEQLKVGMRPADVFTSTTVRNWGKQCYNLFNYLPSKCPDCGNDHAIVNEREQVVCSSCKVRLTPLDGDTISRKLVQDFVDANLAISA